MNNAKGYFESTFGRVCVDLVRDGENVIANIEYSKNAPVKVNLPMHYILG